MSATLRRGLAVAAVVAAAIGGSPLVGTANADGQMTQASFAPTSPTTNSHPTITATYGDTVDPSSTITLKMGTNTIACPQTVSGKTINCTPTNLLKEGAYTVLIHAVDAPPGTLTPKDDTNNFTVNVPGLSSSSPMSGQFVGALPSGKVTVNYDQPIDNTASTISVQQVADADGTPDVHTPLTGTTSYTTQKSMTDNNSFQTITFQPTSSLVQGVYQVSTDVFGVTASPTAPIGNSTENAQAEDKDVFTFTVAPPPAPTNLNSPAITNANKTAAIFSGTASPGSNVSITVIDANAAKNVTGSFTNVPATGQWSITLDVHNMDDTNAGTWTAKANDGIDSPTTTGSYTKVTAPPAPTNLNSPGINISNKSSVTFSGLATPGTNVSITVIDAATPANNQTGTFTNVPANGQWSIQINASNMDDTTNGTWTAKANNDVDSPVATGSYIKDTVAPKTPTVVPSFPTDSTTLNVAVTENDPSVDHYTVTITDPNSAHTVGPVTVPHSALDSQGNFTQNFDVSALNDGTLTVTVTALDLAGNTATPATAPTITKAAGVHPEFNQSLFTFSGNGTATFPVVEARSGQAIQKPTSIVVAFTSPVSTTCADQSQLPNSMDATAPSPVFQDNNGTGNKFTGTAANGATANQLIVTPPPGLADGGYTLQVAAYAATCKFDSSGVSMTLPHTAPSPDFNAVITVPITNNPPFVFDVDTQGPAAPVFSTIPSSTIDASNVGDVLIKGTGEPNSTVVVTVSSSGGPGLFQANSGNPIAVNASGNWSDEEFGGLSVLHDGLLTITATPTDVAGNQGTPGTYHVELDARPSPPQALSITNGSDNFTAHWFAPNYDGFGSPATKLTGYTLTYRDTTNGAADTSTHTVNISDKNATSQNVGGLITGDTYAVTLCALNGVDGPCNTATATANPRIVTAISESVSKALVVYGSSITLSGRLTRPDIGAGIANTAITVTPRFDNGTTGSVIHLTTDSFGFWKVTFKPSKDAIYTAAFAGQPIYAPSSTRVASLVEVALRIDRVAARSSSHTSPVTISGHLSPNEAGRYVFFYARQPGANHYQRIGYAKLSSSSTYSWTHTFPRGTFYLYARFPTQNGVIGANSNQVKFFRT